MRLDQLPPPRVPGQALSTLRAPAPAAGPRSPLEALIPSRETAHGRLHLAEAILGAAPAFSAEALSALALTDEAVDLRAPLFFDTETTGLAGGTGTLPFLVGVAEWRGAEAWCLQAHLPAPGEERPLLSWLAERIEASTALVSFNGKSFDWPLLRTRYVMNRLRPPPERPHVDLLHCARRVYRHALREVRLTTLEREVLGVTRVGDLDGALIPPAWFDYLRTGRVATLRRVLEHNRRDVDSMVRLAAHLADAWAGQAALTPAAAFGLATLAVRRGDEARALELLTLANQAAGRRPWRVEALRLHALVLRRRGQPRRALERLEEALALEPRAPATHLLLSKLLEHELRDYDAALRHARAAHEAEPADAHARRVARLQRRAAAAVTPRLLPAANAAPVTP
jgi:uncharacterized protein YprB with RNaseH-like and TPR domain